MKRYLLAGAAVVAAVVLVWWLRSGSSDDAKPDKPDKPDKQAHKDDGPKKPARDGKRDDTRGGDGEMQVLVDDDPKGDLRLEGIVFGADDAPVEGATVSLAANPPRKTTTQKDGTFAFDNLVARPYTLVARAPSSDRGKGGVAGPVTARLTAKSDPVQMHLRPASSLKVTVTATNGKPVEGATVELRGIDDQREDTKTGGIATFDAVVPGQYQLAGWATGMAHSSQFLSVGAGENQAHLVLQPGAPVDGVVVNAQGQPVKGARVVYSGASNWSNQGSRRHDAVVTTDKGEFHFDALPAGTFRFLATHDDLAPGSSAPITLDGQTAKTGVTVTLPDGATVSGTVVDASHQPVAGARIRVGVASRNAIFEPPRQAYSDEKGKFEIHGIARREHVAVAIHESGASKDVPVDASKGDVSGIELVLEVNGVIAGTVVDPSGQPLEGVQVQAGPNFRDSRGTGDFQQWRLRGFPEDLTDAGGHFQLSGLAPGSYNVTATRSQALSRGRRGAGEGTVATAGTRDLKIVLQPEGGVKGKLQMADGSVPAMFTVSVGMTQQSFGGGDGSFEIDSLAPQKYTLDIRGAQFQAKSVDVTIDPSKTADLGTISVSPGRTIGGIVMADGQPVPNADVFAGRVIFGNGTSNSAQFGPMGQSTKQTTTGPDGTFSLSGFSDGDITIVAEQGDIGRSKAIRLPTVAPGQTELTLELQKFGALSGVLRQGGKPAEGVFVSAQSTTTPGALYNVASGPDGTYRFDRLAPDTYKVSATLGMPMMGMRFYSQQIDVPSGKEVTVDLTADGGSVTLNVTAVPKSGTLGVASVWLPSGTVTATTANDLALKLAALGQSTSQWVIIRSGEPAEMKELTPGTYSACVVPFPAEVKGMGAMSYSEKHGDTLKAFCQAVTVAASPATQSVSVSVELPPFVPDGGGSGSATQK